MYPEPLPNFRGSLSEYEWLVLAIVAESKLLAKR